jgi:2-methylcitrate dehydratase PrpD
MTRPLAGSGFEPLLDWVEKLQEQPLEDDVREAVEGRLVDYAASVAGGSPRTAVALLAEHAGESTGGIPLPGGGTASPVAAALPWGAAAHVLECDDTHQPSSTHPGSVVVTTALLGAAEAGLSMAKTSTAIVAGYEFMCRLGETSGPTNEYARGFHPTGTCGAFGAAAAAAVLYELDRSQLRSALGIAASFASGSMAFLTNGAWTKLLHPGNAARSGLMAARLARRGFRGPDDPVSPPHGYLAGHAPQGADLRISAPEPNEPLAVQTTSVKAHGCCRYEQGPIDALLDIRSRESIAAADVRSVRVGLLEAAWNIVAEPLEAKRRPATTVDAQFSMPFGAALALVRGSASPLDHDETNLADPEVQRLADLVECYRDPDLDADYPRKWRAAVEVTMADETVHRAAIDHPRGDPENPLTLDELVARIPAFAPWSRGCETAVVECARDHRGEADALVAAIASCFPSEEETR